MKGINFSGQLLFDDFSTHTPTKASGIALMATDDSGSVLVEQTYENDRKLPIKELITAASTDFRDAVASELRV